MEKSFFDGYKAEWVIEHIEDTLDGEYEYWWIHLKYDERQNSGYVGQTLGEAFEQYYLGVFGDD